MQTTYAPPDFRAQKEHFFLNINSKTAVGLSPYLFNPITNAFLPNLAHFIPSKQNSSTNTAAVRQKVATIEPRKID